MSAMRLDSSVTSAKKVGLLLEFSEGAVVFELFHEQYRHSCENLIHCVKNGDFSTSSLVSGGPKSTCCSVKPLKQEGIIICCNTHCLPAPCYTDTLGSFGSSSPGSNNTNCGSVIAAEIPDATMFSHTGAGLLTVPCGIPGIALCITMSPKPELDSSSLILGRVVSGLSVLVRVMNSGDSFVRGASVISSMPVTNIPSIPTS